MGENLIVSFNKWEDRQGRKDIKRPTWFKLDNSIFDDSKLYDLSAEEMACFVFLLCEASKANKAGNVTINTEYAHRVARIEKTVLSQTIKKLKEKHIVNTRSVRGTYASVRDPYSRIEKNRIEKNIYTSTDVDAQMLFNIWNEGSGTLPKAKKLSPARLRKAKSLLKENPDLSMEYWIEIVRKIKESDFCNGKGNRNWCADFDWFLKPDTHLRVDEGKYSGYAQDNQEKKERPKSVLEDPDFLEKEKTRFENMIKQTEQKNALS